MKASERQAQSERASLQVRLPRIGAAESLPSEQPSISTVPYDSNFGNARLVCLPGFANCYSVSGSPGRVCGLPRIGAAVADSDEVARAFRDDVGGSARDRTAFRPRRSSTAGLLAAGWARARGHSHRRRRGQRDLPKKWPRHFPNTLHVVGHFSSSLAEKRVYRRPATVKRPRRKPAS